MIHDRSDGTKTSQIHLSNISWYSDRNIYSHDEAKVCIFSCEISPKILLFFIARDVSKLILDLGHLTIGSEKNQSEDRVKGQLGSLEEVMQKAYDKFNISLDNIQLLIANAGL